MLPLNTVLFAEYQLTITNSEDNIQRELHDLHQTLQIFGMKISHQKIKIIGREPVRSKTVIGNMI
jgi:hypothetical protein